MLPTPIGNADLDALVVPGTTTQHTRPTCFNGSRISYRANRVIIGFVPIVVPLAHAACTIVQAESIRWKAAYRQWYAVLLTKVRMPFRRFIAPRILLLDETVPCGFFPLHFCGQPFTSPFTISNSIEPTDINNRLSRLLESPVVPMGRRRMVSCLHKSCILLICHYVQIYLIGIEKDSVNRLFIFLTILASH